MLPFEHPVYVTRPFLPPLEEFCEALREIWGNRWLTNDGPLVRRFAQQLKQYCQMENISLFSNGTLALQIAFQGLGVSGEVITTPFTFVATTHALYWNRLRPLFVDIEPDTYTLDPSRVEAAITPWTTAILAVHVYGYPCHLHALADIARRNKLKLIYDAAHAFGVEVDGKPIAHYGDVSMFSFHATKLFHTFEGGMLAFADCHLAKLYGYLRNFGFESETEVVMPGTNAKMNEIQAAMGTVLLQYVPKIISRRRELSNVYRDRLTLIPGVKVPPCVSESVVYNYAYFPVEVQADEFGMTRDELYQDLKEYNVYTRRYFYPLLCDYSCYRHLPVVDPLPIARKVASQILTLPIYPDLAIEDVHRLCDIIVDLSSRATRRAH